jgi:hypothetical protein
MRDFQPFVIETVINPVHRCTNIAVWGGENGYVQQICADAVRRQLLFPVNDNYFSLSTTITPEAARSAAAGGGR